MEEGIKINFNQSLAYTRVFPPNTKIVSLPLKRQDSGGQNKVISIVAQSGITMGGEITLTGYDINNRNFIINERRINSA